MLLGGAGDQVVDGDDLVAAVEQRPAQVRAEEAGAAGDDDPRRIGTSGASGGRRRRSSNPARRALRRGRAGCGCRRRPRRGHRRGDLGEVEPGELRPLRGTTSTSAPAAAAYGSPTSSMPARLAPWALGAAPTVGSKARTVAPLASRLRTIVRHGDSRRSSVPALNVSPSTATSAPRVRRRADAEGLANLADHPPALLLVDVDDALHHREVVAGVGGDLDAAPWSPSGSSCRPSPGPGLRNVLADALVEPMPSHDVVDVGADRLAHRGDGVDERDLRRQEAVGGVLDRLRRRRVGDEHRRVRRRA